MRIALPLRLFLVQMAFILVAGVVAVRLVERKFEDYAETWRLQTATLPAELPLQPLLDEVAGAYLKRLESPYPEVQRQVESTVSETLNLLLKTLPGVASVVVVDEDLRIRFASTPDDVGQGYAREEDRSFLRSDERVERARRVAGVTHTEVAWPVFAPALEPDVAGPSPRLGTLLVRFRPAAVVGETFGTGRFAVEPIAWREMAFPLAIVAVVIVAGALVLAAVSGVPVRRLERALEDYRARGFRGGIDTDQFPLPGEYAPTLRAINEMGGRLAKLDALGREREVLLATLGQSLEEGMIVVDSSGNPVAWNAAAARLLDGSAEAGDEKGAAREARFRHVFAHCREALLSGGGPSETSPRDVEIRSGSGDTVRLRVSAVPFESRPGERSVLLLVRDVAMLRKVETHLLEAGRFSTLAHLAGALAHEIRNPLNSIGLNAGALSEILDGRPLEGSVGSMREAVGIIEGETSRLTDLLNNYLGLLRSTPEPGAVDLTDLCRRVIQLLRYTAIRAGVSLDFNQGEATPPVLGVPDRLQQAVLNLVINALQATPPGGTVTLALVSDADWVRLTVSDTGPGVRPEIEEQLFDAKVSTKPEGSGLGLPVVRMIAEAHGGSVSYARNDGRGATFTLALPCPADPTAQPGPGVF